MAVSLKSFFIAVLMGAAMVRARVRVSVRVRVRVMAIDIEEYRIIGYPTPRSVLPPWPPLLKACLGLI